VQVDPVNPTFKAPETNRLKLEFDGLLSTFAFNFNLRHYHMIHTVLMQCLRKTLERRAAAAEAERLKHLGLTV